MPRTSRGRSGGSGMTGCVAKLMVLAIIALLGFIFLPSEWLGLGSEPEDDSAPATATAAEDADAPTTVAADAPERDAAEPDAPKAAVEAEPDAAPKTDPGASRNACKVRDVINGQSFRAFVGDNLRTIRLLYIDAPRAGEPMYDDAKKALAGILADGDVSLEYVDGFEGDRDGRVLAYVFAGGTHANVDMVCRGLAIPWRRGAGSSYESELVGAVEDAKNAKRGIWGCLKVMTQDMKRHVAKSVASDGSSRVTLHDGRTVTLRNFMSVRIADVEREELYKLFGFGEGDRILKEAGR